MAPGSCADLPTIIAIASLLLSKSHANFLLDNSNPEPPGERCSRIHRPNLAQLDRTKLPHSPEGESSLPKVTQQLYDGTGTKPGDTVEHFLLREQHSVI